MNFHGIEHSVRWGIGVIGSHWQLATPSRDEIVGALKKVHQNDDIENYILPLIGIPSIPGVESTK